MKLTNDHQIEQINAEDHRSPYFDDGFKPDVKLPDHFRKAEAFIKSAVPLREIKNHYKNPSALGGLMEFNRHLFGKGDQNESD